MTIVCGLKWGIIGILLGKIVSLLAIVVLWKPYYLFTNGFKLPVSIFWKRALRNYAISAFALTAAVYTMQYVPINPYESIWMWIAYCAVGMPVFLAYDLTATLLFAKGAKDSLNRVKTLRRK